MSLVSSRFTSSSAARIVRLPMWETSKTPQPARTARCSVTVPAGYSRGICQPAKSPIRAPAATCHACRAVVRAGEPLDMCRTVRHSRYADDIRLAPVGVAVLVPKLVSSDAASVAGDVLVLLSGSNGRILAATGTLTTTQRRQLTEAVAAVGGTGPVGIPGSVIGPPDIRARAAALNR